MDENIEIFYGKNKIKISKDLNFKDLKFKILTKEKRLIKFFSFENKKINENLFVSDFPKFKICIDKSQFSEFKKGQFRCKRCRKYLKLNNLICNHSSICRTFYNFKKKEPINEIIDGGYFDEEKEEKESNASENANFDYKEEIDKLFEKHKKNKEKKMLEKINEILARNENNESSIDEQSFPFNKEKNLNNLEFE